ncbi:uncharacterized protein TNCV_38701 [Trichonephila clavipes]|nr:uncharacterized protein TNCV_38701 [Trichonephila clavipes]
MGKKSRKGRKKCTAFADVRRLKKILCFRDKRISSKAIRSDPSDAGVSVSSKTIRNRLADKDSAACKTVNCYLTWLVQQKKVQDSKCCREFQTWWAEKYGMINKGDKAVCVLCSGTVVCRTSSVKRDFETNHKSFCEESEPEQKELIASAIKD